MLSGVLPLLDQAVTLKRRCISIFSPSLPGYLPARLAGERSNRLAPTSLQMACTSRRLPVPRGPVSRTDLIKGACSWTAADPTTLQTFKLLLLKVFMVFSSQLPLCIRGVCATCQLVNCCLVWKNDFWWYVKITSFNFHLAFVLLYLLVKLHFCLSVLNLLSSKAVRYIGISLLFFLLLLNNTQT